MQKKTLGQGKKQCRCHEVEIRVVWNEEKPSGPGGGLLVCVSGARLYGRDLNLRSGRSMHSRL